MDIPQDTIEQLGQRALAVQADVDASEEVVQQPPAEPLVEIPPELLHATSFLCGAAGCGKTYLARAMVRQLPGTLLCATTGIAAVNLGEGTTINAALGYFDTKSLQDAYVSGFLIARLGKLWKAGVRRILLDEVSMMDGEQLTILTQALEELSGRGYVRDVALADEVGGSGIALNLIGDFCQLPPVKAPFAFESPEWGRYADHLHRLTKVWRQADQDFITALQAARRGDADTVCDFFGPSLCDTTDDHFDGPTLYATNEEVERFNGLRMLRLAGAPQAYRPVRWGKQRGDWKNVPEQLDLKVGALVMILANQRGMAQANGMPGRLIYANGDLGTVEHMTAHSASITLQRNGETVEVDFIRRENTIPLEPGRARQLRAEGKEALLSPMDKPKFEIVGTVDYLPVRVAYGTTTHKCVARGTRVQTTTRGTVAVEELCAGDALPTGTVKAIVRTQQPAWRIKTRLGYTVVASPNHRWVTEGGLRETRELIVGEDRIQLALGQPTGGRQFDPSIAYWLGLLVGDGCYTDIDDGTLHFSCVTHPELGDAFARGALKLGARTCSWRKDRRGLHTSSRTLRDQLEDWGVSYVKAPDKSVPSVVWEMDGACRGQFLAGLFDTDGSVGRSGVIFCSASRQLAAEVQELLLSLGVLSRCQEYPGRKVPYYQVYIAAANLSAFRAHVGFGCMTKRRRLAETLPNRAQRPADFFDTVVEVLDTQLVVPMFDVEITAPHLLGFGPFLGHNSQGLSLDKVQVNTRAGFFKQPGLLYVSLSRCRTADGLRIVGSVQAIRERCTVHPKIKEWL